MSLPPLLRPSVPPAAVAPQAQPVSLTVPAGQVPAQFAHQLPQSATVAASRPLPEGGFEVQLQLANGATVAAKSPVPLPPGTNLTLAAPAPQGSPAQPQTLLLRALPTPPPKVPLTAPGAPVTAPQAPNIQPNIQAQPPILGVQLPLVQLAAPGQPLAGPLPLLVPPGTNLAAQHAGQPFTLTLSSPTGGTLQPPQGPPLRVALPEPLNLPLNRPLPLRMPTTSSNPAAPTPYGQTQVTAQLLGHTAAPVGLPATNPLLQALRVLVPEGTPPGTQSARILGAAATPAAPNQVTPQTARLLLSSGQTATLEATPEPASPLPTAQPRGATVPITQQTLATALQPGNVLIVNIPTVTGPAQVVQVLGHTPQQQQGTLQQAAQPVAPQTVQAVPALNNLAPGTLLQGTVQGQNAQGLPLVQIQPPATLQGQTFALNLPHTQNGQPPLMLGTTVQLRLNTLTTANGTPQAVLELLGATLPPAAARNAALAALQGPSGLVASLAQGLNLLQTQQPAAAQKARAQLPSLLNLLPGLLRLMESAGQTELAPLLGREAQTLLQAMGSPVPAMAEQLHALHQRPEDGGWRGVVFPFVENPDGHPKEGNFFWRREKPDDARSPTTTRFVVELALQNLGPTQLDGLIHYPEIWLKLRLTPTVTVPEGFTQGLQALVLDMLQALQLQGGIAVETAAQFPVNPAQEIRQRLEDGHDLGTVNLS